MNEIDEYIRKEQNTSKVFDRLRSGRKMPAVDINEADKVVDIDLHDVNNKVIRKDKKVIVTDNRNKVVTTGNKKTETVPVVRTAIALQKLIIRRTASFCFGNPVSYDYSTDDKQQEIVGNAVNRIIEDNKMSSKDRKIARTIFTYKECAELWFHDKVEKHDNYGFDTEYEIKCFIISPKEGNILYPFFDGRGKMLAFSRQFVITDENNTAVTMFETYTPEYIYQWSNSKEGWKLSEGYPMVNPIGKIPVCYGSQPDFETEDVDNMITRLEFLLSNFGDTNDYHSAPKIFTTGRINGWAKKGDSGAVIEGEPGSTMQYISWQNAPESVKLEIETLLKLIYSIAQTPDISFESVKGLAAISGVALKLLFMDAHLKVKDKMEIFDDYLPRRVNIIKSYLKLLNTSLTDACNHLIIKPKVTPYIPIDETEEINKNLAANGNKPLISHKTSVRNAGLVQNPDAEYEQIQKEEEEANAHLMGEPMF